MVSTVCCHSRVAGSNPTRGKRKVCHLCNIYTVPPVYPAVMGTQYNWVQIHYLVSSEFVLVTPRCYGERRRVLCSSATLQLFKTWQSVWLFPQSLQSADRWSPFLHSASLALWGRVSLAALRANFICADGRDCVVFVHTEAAFAFTVRKSFP